MGIVNRVVGDEEYEAVLWETAKDLASRPTRSIARTKRLLNQSSDSPFSPNSNGKRAAIAWSSTTPDFAEGVKAFVEKRNRNLRDKKF